MANVNGTDINLMPTDGMRKEAERYRAWKKEGEGGGTDDARTRAQQVSGCSGWFVPSAPQYQNPGYQCRAYWNITPSVCYWSNTPSGYNDSHAQALNDTFSNMNRVKPISMRVRAFRCVTY